ncbi:hypothetical protein [Natrinema soli]|nr:hypothetical protein [Natrinema soli]
MAVIGASMTKFGQRAGEWITDLLARRVLTVPTVTEGQQIDSFTPAEDFAHTFPFVL